MHFRGPAGAGKTTLALNVAAHLGRPVSLVTGDSRMANADLIGREIGQTTSHVQDRYIHRVVKTATETRFSWADSVLTEAMLDGHTLVYDEFSRAPAERCRTVSSRNWLTGSGNFRPLRATCRSWSH